MDSSTVFWIGGAVAVFVFLDVLFVEMRRCGREAARIARRLAAYADLPIVSLAAGTPSELARLERALIEIVALLDRARSALAALGVGREKDASA